MKKKADQIIELGVLIIPEILLIVLIFMGISGVISFILTLILIFVIVAIAVLYKIIIRKKTQLIDDKEMP